MNGFSLGSPLWRFALFLFINREYVIGLSLVSQPANSDQTLRRAFEIFDERKEGFITFAEVKNQGMECGICKARNKKAYRRQLG